MANLKDGINEMIKDATKTSVEDYGGLKVHRKNGEIEKIETPKIDDDYERSYGAAPEYEGDESLEEFKKRWDAYISDYDRFMGKTTKDKKQSDYDVFNSIHYTPDKYGRSNYVEGEKKKIWDELNKHFELPEYDDRYDFLVNDEAKEVSLFKNGVLDGRGFGGWKEKPVNMGVLKRRK